jgi:fumarate hydratase subunit alpha
MRTISTKVLEDIIYEALISATYKISEDLKIALKNAYNKETSPLAKYVLSQIIKNYEIAQSEKISLCQDTGRIVMFVEMGQEAVFSEGFLLSALYKAISRASSDGYLRDSVMSDPLNPESSISNVPPIMHIEFVRGDRIKIYIMLKGAGSENVSFTKIYSPAVPAETIKEEIFEKIKSDLIKACPPVIVGIGIGGTFEYSAILAKKALLRKLDSHNKNQFYAKWEKELLEKINKTNIGPMGVGGKTTALGVNIEYAPSHVSSIPVSVNISCHSLRVSKIVI